MAITRFQDLPSTNTPINSENLNGNFDELGVKVGTSVDSNYKTNFIKGSNIINSINVDNEKFTETIGVGTSVNSANRVNVLHSSNLWHYDTTKTAMGVTSTYENSTIKLNGTATGSEFNVPTNLAMLHLNAGNYTLKLTEISGTKPGGQSLIIRNVTTSTNLVDAGFSTTNTYTFALSSDADIAVMVYFWNGNVFNNYKFGVQLQESSTTNTYEPYVTPSIVVDGETIYTKGQNEEYSTVEQRIGTWIDGKPLYRKVIDIPILTAGDYTYNVSSLNIATVLCFKGYCTVANQINTYRPLPYTTFNSNLNQFQGCWVESFDNNNIIVRSFWNSSVIHLILEYTKTTD